VEEKLNVINQHADHEAAEDHPLPVHAVIAPGRLVRADPVVLFFVTAQWRMRRGMKR
jgi:hypothetical protein